MSRFKSFPRLNQDTIFSSFSEYAEHGIGRWAGFTQGWIYWLATVAVLGAEITGAAGFIGSWFNVSPWIPAAVCVVLFGIINLLRVRSFGEFEYWFALIKVVVIVAFLIIGALLILGLLPGHSFIGTSVGRCHTSLTASQTSCPLTRSDPTGSQRSP